ncbi:MAG TPA: hypothetical protein VN426_02580 [Syntrophomonadaceae bacterium]|nr:hypothetical protein [Syntrophomonadaceae bacterium]
MLSKDGIKARYIFTLCCFLASGSQMVTGLAASICGVLGCIELSTALLGYSPLQELLEMLHDKRSSKQY